METNLCVAGFGGQGVMTLGKFLASATCDATNKNVTFFPSYGAEQRGGTANCFVVISDEEIGAPLGDVMDDLIVMNGPSLKKFLPTLKKGGTLFINSSIVSDDIGRDDVKLVKACLLYTSPSYSSRALFWPRRLLLPPASSSTPQHVLRKVNDPHHLIIGQCRACLLYTSRCV